MINELEYFTFFYGKINIAKVIQTRTYFAKLKQKEGDELADGLLEELFEIIIHSFDPDYTDLVDDFNVLNLRAYLKNEFGPNEVDTLIESVESKTFTEAQADELLQKLYDLKEGFEIGLNRMQGRKDFRDLLFEFYYKAQLGVTVYEEYLDLV